MTSTTIITTKTDSWLDWFKSRESGTTINQSNQEKLFSTFSSNISKIDCLNSVMQHGETSFLHKASFGERNVTIFHHLVSAGGTIYDSQGKAYGFIQGLGYSTASAMTPDIDTLFATSEEAALAVPSVTQILAVTSIENVDGLTDSATVTYKPRNLIPIPPFLLETIQTSISKSNGNSKPILVECVKAIKDFDTKHANDTTYEDKARAKCKDILFWLYLVSSGNAAIDAVPVTGCNNEKVAEELKNVSSKALKPKTTSDPSTSISAQVERLLKCPFEVLATSASSTSDFMEKLTQLQNQSSEKSSKSFKKIPTKYQNMILVAASVGEITVLDYDADAVEFFKCSNNLNAQVMLNSLLETEGIDCSISSAVTASLLYGSFLWKDALSPSGLAAAVISSEGIFRSDTLHDGMVLDYATRYDMSASSLTKLTKTQVAFPADTEELIHRLKALHVLAQFFFKRSGYMSQGLQKLINFCVSNRMLIKTRIHLDSRFIAKMICAVDERIYLWLKQCSSQASVVDTDLELMNFSQISQDIQFNRFNYILPPRVAKIQKQDNAETESSAIKKKKFEAERNTNQVREWKLRQSESWDDIFLNKTNAAPILSMGCRACLKFQVKGICYTDCKHKQSHTQLSGDDKSKLDKYIKELRGE